MKKIILDTDIGSDIDDAICLAWLLAETNCDLIGITTVTGEAETRAKIASALCKTAGKHLPIYPGCSFPILIEQHQKNVPQAEALTRWDHQNSFPHAQAVHFLQDMIHTYPKEISLVSIGPLTNIAQLFIIDPEIPALLKEIICMNGLFSNQIAGVGPLEWNAMGDPHASAIVYNRTQFNHKSIGLDITCQVGMSADDALKRFNGDLLQCVMDFAHSFFEHSQWITFHDPLAALVAFDDTICEFKRGKVDIELNSQRLAGHTHWIDDNDGPHRIAHSVNCDRFFDLFFAPFNT